MVTTKSHAQAPARSLDQRMEALQRANDVRVRRAQLKRDLKAGSESIESILLAPPEWVETAKVFDMLMAVPKFGRVKAARLLNQCRISQSKTVGGLSERQRAELVELFNHSVVNLRQDRKSARAEFPVAREPLKASASRPRSGR